MEEMLFTKSLKLKKNLFISLRLIFSCYYCSIDLKKQLEHSGLCPDKSNLVVLLCTKFMMLEYLPETIRYQLGGSRKSKA